MDTKSGMNMGGSRFSSLIADLSDTVDRINDKMSVGITRASTFATVLGGALNSLNARTGGLFNGGQVSTSANTVMQQPTPQPSGLLGPNGLPLMTVANYNSGNNNGGTPPPAGGLSGALSPQSKSAIAIGLNTAAVINQALPKTSDQVAMNYLTNRAMAFGMQNPNSQPNSASWIPGWAPFPFMNTREEAYNRVSGMYRSMAASATITDPMEIARGSAVAQAAGVGMGLPNYLNIMNGIGTMSSLTPGVGFEKSAAAYGALQAPRSVNMLRSIGIQIRDPMTGQMKNFKQIANDVWDKLNREKLGTESITVEDLDTGFMPGGSLDSMLNNFFGGDEFLKAQVKTALYARARGVSKSYKKEELKQAGITTEAILSFSDRQKKAMEGISQTSRAGAGAFTVGNQAAEAMQSAANAMDRLTGVLSFGAFGKGLLNTIGGAANGTPATLFGMLLSSLGIGAKADGGEVGGNKPYIVGEEGPELFLPKTDGVIIPNHLLNTDNRHAGGGVAHSHAWGADPMKMGDITSILKQAGFKGEGLQNALTILKHESGYNKFAWNPPSTGTGDDSYGLFQINMIGKLYKERMEKEWKIAGSKDTFKLGSVADLYDPLTNARVAYHMSKGGMDWSSWTTKKYLNDKDAKPSGNYSGTSSNSSGRGGSNIVSDIVSSVGSSLRSFLGKFAPDTLASMQSPSGSAASNTTVTGGVTINITADKDPEKTAAAVKKALEGQSLRSFVGGN